MTDETTNYTEIATVNCGRHSDLDDDVDCLRATKKVLLVDRDTDDLDLYHQIECDECGVVAERRIGRSSCTVDGGVCGE